MTTPATRPGTAPSTTVPGTPVWVIAASLPDSARADAGRMPGLGFLDGFDADEVRLVADRSLVLPRRLELLRQRPRRARPLVHRPVDQPADVAVVVCTEGAGGIGVDSDDAGFAATGPGAPRLDGRLRGGDAVVPARRLRAGRHLGEPDVQGGGAELPERLPAAHGDRPTLERLPRLWTPSWPGRRPASTSTTRSDPRSITIRSGTLSRRPGWMSTTPVDHVWVDGARTEVMAAGDPSTDELVKILSSLQ